MKNTGLSKHYDPLHQSMKLLYVLLLLVVITRPSHQTTFTCNSTASCGCSTQTAIVTKIVGGEAAQPKSWGWAVALTYNSNQLLCGGTILSSYWILTAAHCVIGKTASLINVYAGSNNLTSFSQASTAATVYMHPNYNTSTYVNDIALLRLNTPFDMSDAGLAKICLPASTTEIYPPINSTLVAIGWGRLAENGSISSTLQQVTLQGVSYFSIGCQSLVYDTSKQFCATVNDSSKGNSQERKMFATFDDALYTGHYIRPVLKSFFSYTFTISFNFIN
ncbi:hypothetical protein I4U23_027247 [Adineta vaga]|nr:hypothetical protein I4U23_027247 [Adineta vaga]